MSAGAPRFGRKNGLRSDMTLCPLLLLSILLLFIPAASTATKLFETSRSHTRALLVGRTFVDDSDSADSGEGSLLGEPSWCKNKNSNARFGNKRRCGCKDGPPQVIKDGACCSMIGFRNGQDCNAHGTCDYFRPGPAELESLKKQSKKKKYKYIGEFLEIHEYETPEDFRLNDSDDHHDGASGSEHGRGATGAGNGVNAVNGGARGGVSTAPHGTTHSGDPSGAHRDVGVTTVSRRDDDKGVGGAPDGGDGDDAEDDEGDQDQDQDQDDDGEPAGNKASDSSSSVSRQDRPASPSVPARRLPTAVAPLLLGGTDSGPHQHALPRDIAISHGAEPLLHSQARLAPPAHVLGGYEHEAQHRAGVDDDGGRITRLLHEELRREQEQQKLSHAHQHTAQQQQQQQQHRATAEQVVHQRQQRHEHRPPAVMMMRNPSESKRQSALRDAAAAAAAAEHADHSAHPPTTTKARPLQSTATITATSSSSPAAAAGRAAAAAAPQQRAAPSAAELDSVFPLLRLSPVTSAALRSAANHSRASVVCARQDSPLYRDFTPEFEAHRRRRVEELQARASNRSSSSSSSSSASASASASARSTGSSGGGGGGGGGGRDGDGDGDGISAEEDLFHEVRHYGRANCAGVRDTASFASTLLESLRSWLAPPPLSQPGRLRDAKAAPAFPDDPAGEDYLASVHAAVTSLLEVSSAANTGLADRLHAVLHGQEAATATAAAAAAGQHRAAGGYVGYGAVKSSGRKQYIVFTDVRLCLVVVVL